ncbi:hypothetical protein ABT389_35010 [Streptomyces bacillaris]|uniref:hypothetical protein n=1 Tax=Streptomyces bacillaris TaxID=68179 RepID=UPI00335FC767
MADQAREFPAVGGTILDRWPDIAATVAPQLPDPRLQSPSTRRPDNWTCAPTPRPTPPS